MRPVSKICGRNSILAIGANTYKSLGIPSDDAEGVLSAEELFRTMGDGNAPDLKGKWVDIVGGGNVAMDCTHPAMRLGAASVKCVYRRRQADMTALAEEVEGAIAETCEMVTMMAPVRVESDENGKVAALIVQSQIPGGRSSPARTDKDEVRIECDMVIGVIGQAVDSIPFAEGAERGGRLPGLRSGGRGQRQAVRSLPEEGMKVLTDTPRVRAARRTNVQLALS